MHHINIWSLALFAPKNLFFGVPCWTYADCDWSPTKMWLSWTPSLLVGRSFAISLVFQDLLERMCGNPKEFLEVCIPVPQNHELHQLRVCPERKRLSAKEARFVVVWLPVFPRQIFGKCYFVFVGQLVRIWREHVAGSTGMHWTRGCPPLCVLVSGRPWRGPWRKLQGKWAFLPAFAWCRGQTLGDKVVFMSC